MTTSSSIDDKIDSICAIIEKRLVSDDYLSIKAAEDFAKEYVTYTKRTYLPDLTGSASYNFQIDIWYGKRNF